MPKRTPCTWEGQDYRSIADAAAANPDTLYITLYQWIERGYTSRAQAEAANPTGGKPVIWRDANGNETTYESLSDFARARGCSRQYARQLVRGERRTRKGTLRYVTP